MHIRSLLLPLVLALAAPLLTTGPAQAATRAPIEGSGSSSAAAVIAQWMADVEPDGMKVAYAGVGSPAGRKDFARGSSDFAMTEFPYQGVDELGAVDTAGDRELRYVPLVGGALAFSYHLQVGDQPVTDLHLSGKTIAKIFTNQITNWDDPAITADNGGRQLPPLPITPVVQAHEASTSAVFTTWLDRTYPTIWRPYFGRSGPTSYFPQKSGSGTVSASGSRDAMNTVTGESGNGTITYVELFEALNRRAPVATVGTAEGRWVSPTNRAGWAALRHATAAADGSVVLDSLLESPDPEAYPIVYVSHAIIPTGSNDRRMTTAKRQTIVDFTAYGLCGGQRMASLYGSAPLPLNLVRSGLEQVARLKSADPDVDLTRANVSTCQNPTFDPITQTDIPPGCASFQIGKPLISGLPKVGQTLTASVPSAEGGDTYTFAWNAGDSVIAGATQATYEPRSADIGKAISVTATPHRPTCEGIPVTSDSTQTVVADPVASAPVTAPVTVKKATLKVTKTPTRKKSGAARVTLIPTDGGSLVSGRTTTVLTLKLGSKSVTRRATVTFTNGRATIALPKLPKKGRWRVSITIPKSNVVPAATRSKVLIVQVRK